MKELTTFRMSPPPPMAPPALPPAFMSPVAWLVTAHFASLGLCGRAISLSRLVEHPGPFGTESLWEMLKRVVFLLTRRQAKNPRGRILDVHIRIIPRHFANSQYRIVVASAFYGLICQILRMMDLLESTAACLLSLYVLGPKRVTRPAP